MTKDWSPTSWKSKPCMQIVEYPDNAKLDQVLNRLHKMPPMVAPVEIDSLKKQLAAVARGEAFLLQGGDCAELFEYCSQIPIENKIKVLLQMSLILVWGARTPVVRIARMAGQYAKPRSKPTEMIDGKEYIAFRGDNVNGIGLHERTPDPDRLLSAYLHSSTTMNYVRSVLDSGFADLHRTKEWSLEEWNMGHVQSQSTRTEYESVVQQLADALDFMSTIGADSDEQSSRTMKTVDLFVSHEGLLLDFETTLTRKVKRGNGKEEWYNLGTHFLWIGDRTRQLDGGHVEYFRGIANPIGVKVGPSMKPEELVRLLDILNPDHVPGKVTLITRYGTAKVRECLPDHIRAVQQTKHLVVWCCDPMHGNTELSATGIKTRNFDNIAAELRANFEIHKELKSHLGGVHFELTGDRVTECLGGSMCLTEAHLSENYKTFCDPRLNYEQSLDIAFMIAKYCEGERRLKKQASKQSLSGL